MKTAEVGGGVQNRGISYIPLEQTGLFHGSSTFVHGSKLSCRVEQALTYLLRVGSNIKEPFLIFPPIDRVSCSLPLCTPMFFCTCFPDL